MGHYNSGHAGCGGRSGLAAAGGAQLKGLSGKVVSPERAEAGTTGHSPRPERGPPTLAHAPPRHGGPAGGVLRSAQA
ncbi:hypothetical protein DGo_CA0100 [Deinococcus gobiensis I-0]|uniref:Uncharacterized protein n=1 Tax=Deinococcus gobiensis (strain DSM 21396 / JCM 16679 / CGMCC 1.7299 / I-0) TaxID=745776 RepID=H8GSS1_DEIGI|nr:hypothetical protein DGo_CA0100 [Deinococcus gobiensis I-0]